MYTKEEQAFIEYWQQNREQKKKVFRQLAVGLPLGTTLVIAIFANFFSGWFRRAEMVFNRENSSLVLVLLVAALLIVVFVIVFSVRHKWDQHEQRYKELLARENKQ